MKGARSLGFLLLGIGCAAGPDDGGGTGTNGIGRAGAPGGAGGPFEVPACILATGDPAPGGRELVDESGKATVEVLGAGCARTFLVATTAPRQDDLPASPRPVKEAGGTSVQTNHPLFDALYRLAVDEAAENSVSAIRDGAFHHGASLPCPPGGCFETGRKWTYVWTRDTAYAAHLGLGWVDPVRAKNSLELKLSPRRDGSRPEIVQDTGTGGSWPVSTDRVVWALGAAEILQHLTGDARARFRDAALVAGKNTAERDRAVVFDPTDGLYRGEQSFLDWREQTYPGWTVPDTVHIGQSKSLSTNVGHLALHELVADLAAEVGDTATATTMRARADALRTAIRTRFWLPEDRQLSTYVTTELDPSPVRRFDLLGTSLAVLHDVTTPEQARAAIASYPTLPKGPPVIFPQQKETPIYHNRAIWPFVTAFWAKAARKVGNDAAFDAAVRSLVRGAALNLSNMENLELVSGRPWVADGPYSGPVVNSQRQLWSVAGYIGTVVGGVFGVSLERGGVRVEPFVTRGLRRTFFAGARSIALNDLPIRDRKISVVVHFPDDPGLAAGGAYRVARVRLNGAALDGVAPASALQERNLAEVELELPEDAGAAVRTITDLSDYRVIFGPRTPSIGSFGLADGKVTLRADLSGEDPGAVTWSVYRDGARVATDLPGTAPTWSDPATGGEGSPSHCYSIETRYPTGTVSQHASPACFWGTGATRVASVHADAFSVTGGRLVHAHGRTFPQAWGDPGHEIRATFQASRTGPHLVQAVYANGAGGLNTGITCALKHVVVEELPGGAVVGGGYLMMPQRGDWASWGDSSFVRVNLTAGRSYRVRLEHDDRSVNMSAFQHFEAYTGGMGGSGGAFFHVNVAELKLLALVP